MEITSAEFVISNTDVKKCPAGIFPEYAFIGRSNVGKSSLINMLTARKGLDMTSANPGKTMLINHFLIIICFCCVDWEHTRRITDSKNSLTCQFPVYITRKRCNKINILYMFFFVQDCLIQMCSAPSLWHIETE